MILLTPKGSKNMNSIFEANSPQPGRNGKMVNF